MVPRVLTMKITLLYLLNLVLTVKCQSQDNCATALQQLDQPFMCGNEHNACSEVALTDTCSIYCCPNNQTMAVESLPDTIEVQYTRQYIKSNIAQIAYNEYVLELEEPRSISKRAQGSI